MLSKRHALKNRRGEKKSTIDSPPRLMKEYHHLTRASHSWASHSWRPEGDRQINDLFKSAPVQMLFFHPCFFVFFSFFLYFHKKLFALPIQLQNTIVHGQCRGVHTATGAYRIEWLLF
jgi:hypothetical protein